MTRTCAGAARSLGGAYAGREGELGRVAELAADPAAAGLLVRAAPGLGRTRLLAEAAGRLEAAGARVVRLTGTWAAREVPWGAFADVPVPEGAPSPGDPLGWAGVPEGGRLVLAVDDAHLLDAASAALVARLAGAGRAFALLSAVAGGVVPEAAAGLPVLELGPLPAAAVAGLLSGAPEEVRRLREECGGNPLLLAELLAAPGRCGTLRELVAARMAGLPGPLRELVELVAFGEPVGCGVLALLVSPVVLAEAAERGLVEVAGGGRRTVVRLGHPLYGEVVVAGAAPERAALRRAELAGAVERLGARRREDPLRMALWRLDSGEPGAPGPLVTACRLAWAAHDHRLALRLGEAAVAAGGGVDAAVALANVLMNVNRHEDGEAALLEVWDRALDERDRVLLTTVRAGLLFGMDRVADAGRLLEDGERRLRDRRLRHELRVARGNLVTLAGQCRAGRAIMEGLLAEEETAPEVTAQARAFRALALSCSGRGGEALAEADLVLSGPAAWRQAAPFLRAVLALARFSAYLHRGELDPAARVLEDVRASGDLRQWPPAQVIFQAAEAAVARLGGAVEEARRIAARPLEEGAPLLMPCLAEVAHAAALAGDVAGARAALAAAGRGRAAFFGLLRHQADQARTWVVAAQDRPPAVEAALLAAARARAESLYGYELTALHDAVRLGAAGRVAGRLAELAGLVDGELAPVCAEHAAAAEAGDAARLAAVAGRFRALGFGLYAGDAQAAANTLLTSAADRTP